MYKDKKKDSYKPSELKRGLKVSSNPCEGRRGGGGLMHGTVAVSISQKLSRTTNCPLRAQGYRSEPTEGDSSHNALVRLAL